MKNLALENYGVDTLSFDEMLCIDGGNFWETLGIIVGIAVAVAVVVAVPAVLIALL
jgi:hypothetical protein